MPNTEYNFDQQQLDLIAGGGASDVSIFDPRYGDYIQMAVFDEDENFITSFSSNIDINSGNVFQYGQDFEPYGSYNTPQLRLYHTLSNTGDTEDDATYDFYVKPNEALQQGGIQEGNYTLKFYFLRNLLDYVDVAATNPQFIISEISPSRREIRLTPTQDGSPQFTFHENFQDSFISTLGTVADNSYTYDWITWLPEVRSALVINHIFDNTDPDDISLILRLLDPFPSDISTLDEVTIEHEIISTHVEDIWYRGGGYIEPAVGVGLGAQQFGGFDENLNINDQVQDTFESYADLTGSLANTSIEQLLFSGSADVNLNINYNDFSNHVFFNSATSKLENFKSKVSDIENYLGSISQSLSGSGILLDGDSSTKIDHRKSLFNNIQNVIDEFTPYERFLYYDLQNETSASAPGIGSNLTKIVPVTGDNNREVLSDYDGFDIVYKMSGSGTNTSINYFQGLYRAEDKPFFNYSGSLYLSFLLKGHHSISGFRYENVNASYDIISGSGQKDKIPEPALGSGSISEPTVTGSEWSRFIFEASQSYWRPTSTYANQLAEDTFVWTVGGQETYYQILSSSKQINSASNSPTGSVDSYAVYPAGDFYRYIGSSVTTADSFSGSFMPSGELFRIKGTLPGNGVSTVVTSSYITDVKITKQSPVHVLPFSFLYSTGSTQWSDWYSGLYESASRFDNDNIHSLQNNLPRSIRDDAQSADLKKFLNMQAEQYDLIRNYIDNFSVFYKRKYSKLESVPTNLLPILSENLGWELIQPFTGSISEYYGATEYDTVAGNKITQEVTYNTWRKVLNNLIYVYKTKGTPESIRAILNIFGYLPDSFPLEEIGGSSEEHNPSIITDDVSKLLQGLEGSTNNVSFQQTKEEFYSYIFNSNINRTLNFDWYTNDATDINTVQFVIKPRRTNNDQLILQSSGSKTEKLWDLRLLTSASNPIYGQLQFRLSDESSGSLTMHHNAVSMSTGYLKLKTGTDLWNVMLQRMTSSISGTGIQQYKLYAGLQNKDKITQFSAVSMSVSGASQTQATASFTFIQSASNGSNITFTSTDATEKTYVALSGSANGAVSGSFVLFATGSGATEGAGSASVAGNLLAAITSSNGHGSRFSSSQNLGAITITQNVAGLEGNKSISTAANFNNATNPNAPSSFVGGTTDSNVYVNQNWLSTGSLNASASDNLYVGATYTGSFAEFRAWSTTLSASKFKQHILNKTSTTGNNIDASFNEIIYRYRFQENWRRGNLSPQIRDANPNKRKDYSINLSSDLLTGSVLYDKDEIDIVKFSVRVGGVGQTDSNKIIINPTEPVLANLSPDNPSTRTVYEKSSAAKRASTDKVQVTRSPAKILNNFIINTIADFDVTSKFGDPGDLYEHSYNDLNTFRDDLFNNFNVTVDINKWIKAQEDTFNHALIDIVKKNIPARAAGSQDKNIGVIFEPTLLERDKIKNPQSSIATGSDVGQLSVEKDFFDTFQLQPVNETSKNASYGVPDNITTGITRDTSKDASYSVSDNITKGITREASKDASYSVPDNIVKTFTHEPFKDADIGFIDSITKKGKILSTIFRQASATFGGHTNMNGNGNTTLTLTNTDFTKVTFTTNNSKSETQSDADEIGTNYTSNNAAIATKSFHVAFAAAISAGTLKMTLTPATYTNETTITLTQDVAGVNGNRTITNPANMYVQGTLLGSSGTTKDFTGGEVIHIRTPDETKSPVITHEMTIETVPAGEESSSHDLGYASFINLADSWGTSSDDTHFVNAAWPTSSILQGNMTSDIARWQNVNYYEKEYVFRLVGDHEILSSSRAPGLSEVHTDYSNPDYFKNSEIRDSGKGYIYKSYINAGNNAEGPIDGRPVGKTAFFATSSNGNILYPSNHFINFSEDGMRQNFIDGYQNIGGSFMILDKYEDLSTASFYSITVAGEDRLLVQRGRRQTTPDGGIETLGGS